MTAEISGDEWFFHCMDCEYSILALLTSPEFESPEQPEAVKQHVRETGHGMNKPQKIG